MEFCDFILINKLKINLINDKYNIFELYAFQLDNHYGKNKL